VYGVFIVKTRKRGRHITSISISSSLPHHAEWTVVGGLAELCTLTHTSLISLNHSRFCLSRLVVCIRCCRNVGLIAYKRLVVSRRKLNEVVERSRIGAERSHCSVKCERCQWGYISIGFLLSPFAYSLSFSLSPKWWKKDCRETRAMGP
jgi:hypothetical protein